MIYLVHGENEYKRSEWLRELRGSVSDDPDMASLNTVTLNAKGLTPEELEGACAAMPFLADKRLVIVEGLVDSKLGKERNQTEETPRRSRRGEVDKRLLAVLAGIPPTTDLVLYESVHFSKPNPYIVAINELGGRVIPMQPPKAGSDELRDWVRKRARTCDLRLTDPALEQLIAYIGNNLRLLDQEIAKLATYADGRPVGDDDIRRLVSYAREQDIFAMVDAIGLKDARGALRRLRQLQNDGVNHSYVATMVVRQFRLIMLARHLLDAAVGAGALAGEMSVHPFVAQKIAQQARNFPAPTLRAIHQHLVDLDWAVKRGRVELDAALDLFVIAAARR